MTLPILGIIVPCFNEEEVLSETTARLIPLIAGMYEEGLIDSHSTIFYVDDGSRDGTWTLIEELSDVFPNVGGIKLTRNCGHQNALLSGLMTAPGDVLISIDADLQDDLKVIPEMVRQYHNGCDIVYGVRKRRNTDSFFKRITAEGYYKFMRVMKVDILFNHADYRLLSRRALNALAEYREVNLFLRGIVRLLGFQNEIVEYDRAERFAGESKYPLRKMISFAWQGATSFSTTPLRFITVMGFIVSLLSICLTFWGLVSYFFLHRTVPGWTSTVIPMYFLGGLQIFSLGIIGEYIAKIYLETKDRPRFHIDKLKGTCFQASNTSDSILVKQRNHSN
jgi:polyisoprenyl-phosphate glycosyltransferase